MFRFHGLLLYLCESLSSLSLSPAQHQVTDKVSTQLVNPVGQLAAKETDIFPDINCIFLIMFHNI